MLFASESRIDPSPKQENETTFAFLSRVRSPLFDLVRQTINSWLENLPQDDAADAIGRLRSGKQDAWDSAIWELYLHEALIRAGFTVDIHPDLKDVPTRPDFLVKGDGEQFFLEAVVVYDGTESDAKEARRGQVLAAVNRVESPNFFVSVRIPREGDYSPPTRSLRKGLKAWLDSLDPDEVIAEVEARGESLDNLPQMEWRSGDWLVKFTAIPKNEEGRSKPGRTVGAYTTGVWRGGVDKRIAAAISAKTKKYGEPHVPLVVAINCLGAYVDTTDINDAVRARLGRDHRLSAVLTAENWSTQFADTNVPLVHRNPEANHALRSSLPWPPDTVASETPRILGLPGTWAELRETSFEEYRRLEDD